MTMFKDLPEEQQRELVWQHHMEAPIEYFVGEHTSWFTKFGGKLNPSTTYRLALTSPSADWSHVHPDYNWLARDQDDEGYFHEREPDQLSCGWSAGPTYSPAAVFTSYNPGTCDWKDSLVQRPAYSNE